LRKRLSTGATGGVKLRSIAVWLFLILDGMGSACWKPWATAWDVVPAETTTAKAAAKGELATLASDLWVTGRCPFDR
jgi:hypothetical protein